MAIIFFDIDGTLAVGTRVPESAAAAVAATRAQGNLVFICSGRPLAYAQKTFGAYADGFICCNGRLAVRGDETLHARGVDGATVDHIVEILDGLDVGYAFFGRDDLYYGGNEDYLSTCEQVHGPVSRLDEARAHDVTLFSFDVFFGDLSERAAIERALEGLCLVNPHGPHPSVDVTVLGYGKGDACLDVAAELGIDGSDTYAFGDGVNDISMVEAVAHGIAMGNAVDALKDVADYVTDAIDEDGVANALARLGLV